MSGKHGGLHGNGGHKGVRASGTLTPRHSRASEAGTGRHSSRHSLSPRRSVKQGRSKRLSNAKVLGAAQEADEVDIEVAAKLAGEDAAGYGDPSRAPLDDETCCCNGKWHTIRCVLGSMGFPTSLLCFALFSGKIRKTAVVSVFGRTGSVGCQ
jgi:hypothetical protein